MVTSDENANTSTAQLMVEQDFHYNIARETVKGDRFDTYVYIASADNLDTHFASDKTEHTQLYSDGSFLTAPPPIVSVLNVPVVVVTHRILRSCTRQALAAREVLKTNIFSIQSRCKYM